MDLNQFKENENKYRELKYQLESGSISSEELKVKLKQMMIRDDEGNYWMIGSNTGKWYIYNGTDWKERNPYPESDLSKTRNFNNISEEMITVQNEEDTSDADILLENNEHEIKAFESEDSSFESEAQPASTEVLRKIDLSDEEDEEAPLDEKPVSAIETSRETLCIICKSMINEHSVYCSYCGANQKELSKKRSKQGEELLIRSVRITSLIFFFGGLGLIAGVIFGATFGIFDIFRDLLQKFPEMLAETRGKIQGGLIFAALGGIGGFFSFAFISGIAGIIYNAFSFLFGGIRIRTR